MADKASNGKAASIGIDVGGTKMRVALFDDKLKVIEDIKLKTPRTKDVFEDESKKIIRKFVRKTKEDGRKVVAIGVGFAGSIDPEKRAITFAPNIPFLTGFSFQESFQDVWKGDIVL